MRKTLSKLSSYNVLSPSTSKEVWRPCHSWLVYLRKVNIMISTRWTRWTAWVAHYSLYFSSWPPVFLPDSLCSCLPVCLSVRFGLKCVSSMSVASHWACLLLLCCLSLFCFWCRVAGSACWIGRAAARGENVKSLKRPKQKRLKPKQHQGPRKGQPRLCNLFAQRKQFLVRPPFTQGCLANKDCERNVSSMLLHPLLILAFESQWYPHNTERWGSSRRFGGFWRSGCDCSLIFFFGRERTWRRFSSFAIVFCSAQVLC